ncbi:MAG: 1-phosphofructokinase family hexose kinase [Oscillospiraceae bacterium]|nr:1-phosphofructokinase family hexose kinase [Oscillospiraceae bacterium]
MVTTVTLNPCIDWTVELPSIALGALNLSRSERIDICGKGVNAAEVLRELGCPVCCTGISFTENGGLLREKLDALGIPHDFAIARGRIRTNIKAYDLEKNQMTELNSLGQPVTSDVLDEFMDKLDALAAKSSIVTLSGRPANGACGDIYRRCVKLIGKYPAKTVLDAEGEPLLLALRAKPYLVKPNLYELETALNAKAGSETEIAAMARELIRLGAGVVCVSMGENGAVITDGSESFYAPALPLTPRGFQGSGDSMVAGICKAILESRGIGDMLRFGIAAASASIIREGTLLCRMDDYIKFLGQVEIRKI